MIKTIIYGKKIIKIKLFYLPAIDNCTKKRSEMLLLLNRFRTLSFKVRNELIKKQKQEINLFHHNLCNIYSKEKGRNKHYDNKIKVFLKLVTTWKKNSEIVVYAVSQGVSLT